METALRIRTFVRRISENISALLRSRSVPWKIALVYAVVGVTWLLCEHYLLGGLAALKDILYLLASALLLYKISEYWVGVIRRQEIELGSIRERIRIVEHFRQMFEQNEEPILLFEPGTARIQDANPAAEALYGYTRQEMTVKGPSLFVVPVELPELEKRISGIDEHRRLVLDRVRHIRRDGENIIVSVRGKSIRLLEGGSISYCTFRDVTERIRMENEAITRQAQLIHASRMAALGTIVSGVAHEINNPNNLIMFNAPMIGKAWRDAEPVLEKFHQENGDFLLGGLPFSEMREIVPKLVDGISGGSARIRNIVGTLKEFARQDTRKQDCRVSANDVVKNAAAILNHEITKKCRNFRVSYDESDPAVQGCSQQLEQVVVNLIMNSLQALRDKNRAIRISTSFDRREGKTGICVEDEGEGMSEDVIKRLSEPFFSTRSEEGGLGLGLSISFSIIKEHGGTIEYRSEAGKGTAARIILPAAPESLEHQCRKSEVRILR
ncbi:MAG: PAS domain S-box protein [Deltaproteobacteria bacterium]|nr:PAS domain S-box protein [Deltaproteobacteria bacterium]